MMAVAVMQFNFLRFFRGGKRGEGRDGGMEGMREEGRREGGMVSDPPNDFPVAPPWYPIPTVIYSLIILLPLQNP